MKAHLLYLRYVLIHKWFVFLECWKLGIPWRGVTHDLSKFSRAEWTPYVMKFFGDPGGLFSPAEKATFAEAWQHHQACNDHHWQHWLLRAPDGHRLHPSLEMSLPARKEMLADWRAMSRVKGGSVVEWYLNNQITMRLGFETQWWVERQLGLEPLQRRSS